MATPPARSDALDAYLEALQEGPAAPFSAWPEPRVPRAAPGVYTIWRGAELVYVGMAGRGMTEAKALAHAVNGDRTGLAERLNSHASGRRSGDPFCVCVADRLVLATLTPEELQQVCQGTLSLDARVRAFIRGSLSYRFAVTRDGAEASALERLVRQGALAAGKPLLNPQR